MVFKATDTVGHFFEIEHLLLKDMFCTKIKPGNNVQDIKKSESSLNPFKRN